MAPVTPQRSSSSKHPPPDRARAPAGRPRPTLLFLALNASYAHTSLAAACLQAAAAGLEWRWVTIESFLKARRWDLLERMQAAAPEVVAVSLYVFNRPALIDILGRFRALRPSALLIAGGPEGDGDNRELLQQEPRFDLVLRGEGEQALRAWLPLYRRRSRWHEIPGACFLTPRGDYHDGGWARPQPDLRFLPAAHCLLPVAPRRPFMPLETTRGCSNRCAFCCSGRRTGLRRLDPASLSMTLQEFKRRGVGAVRVLDRTFNESPRHAPPRLRQLLRECPGMHFHLEIDPVRLDQAFLDELRAAPRGALSLEAGIQTLDPETWRLSGRLGDPARALQGLRALCALPRVTVHADLIAGMPGASLATLRRDVRTLVRLGPEEIQLEVLKLLPGTRWRRQAAALGLAHASTAPYEVLRTPHMAVEDVAYAADLSRGLDWFYNAPQLQAATCLAARRHRGFWDRLVRCVREHGSTPGKPGLPFRLQWLLHTYPADTLLRHAVLRAWLRAGFGERGAWPEIRRWTAPLPADAVLLEGRDQRRVHGLRRFHAQLEQALLFEYGHDEAHRPCTNIYRLDPQNSGDGR